MAGGLATDTTVVSDFSEWLKEWYTDMIQYPRSEKNIFLDERVINFTSEHIAGEYALIPVEFFTQTGVGSRAENAANPIPGAGDWDTAKVELATTVAVLQLSWKLMKQSEGDRAAFAPALITETNRVMRGYRRNNNRMFMGDGKAILAMVDSSPSTNVFDVDNCYGISNTDAGSNGNGHIWLTKNMKVNFFSGTTQVTDCGDLADGDAEITAITRGSGDTEATVTVDTDGSIADSNNIYLAGNKVNGSATNNEIQGLMLNIDDGTVAATHQNITVSGSDWISPVKYGSTAGTVEPLTRTRMVEVWMEIHQRSAGMVDFLFSGPKTQLTYMELADSYGFAAPLTKLDVAPNWEGPAFMGKPMISDPNYPETRIEFIDSSTLEVDELAPADWIPGDVGVLQKVAGYLNYVAEYAWCCNFAIKDRTKCGSLRDIEIIL